MANTFQDENPWVVSHQYDSDAAQAKQWHKGAEVNRGKLGLVDVPDNVTEVSTTDSIPPASGEGRYK